MTVPKLLFGGFYFTKFFLHGEDSFPLRRDLAGCFRVHQSPLRIDPMVCPNAARLGTLSYILWRAPCPSLRFVFQCTLSAPRYFASRWPALRYSVRKPFEPGLRVLHLDQGVYANPRCRRASHLASPCGSRSKLVAGFPPFSLDDIDTLTRGAGSLLLLYKVFPPRRGQLFSSAERTLPPIPWSCFYQVFPPRRGQFCSAERPS